jgi:hypothetical protein
VAAAALALALFAIKAAAAAARRFVPWTPAVRARLEWRRNLARRHDSYQWRKLAWFGLGMAAAALLAGTRESWELPLATASVLSGLLAEAVWRRKRLSTSPPLTA